MSAFLDLGVLVSLYKVFNQVFSPGIHFLVLCSPDGAVLLKKLPLLYMIMFRWFWCFLFDPGWIDVTWDAGGTNSYRMGAEGKYDLTLAPGHDPDKVNLAKDLSNRTDSTAVGGAKVKVTAPADSKQKSNQVGRSLSVHFCSLFCIQSLARCRLIIKIIAECRLNIIPKNYAVHVRLTFKRIFLDWSQKPFCSWSVPSPCQNFYRESLSSFRAHKFISPGFSLMPPKNSSWVHRNGHNSTSLALSQHLADVSYLCTIWWNLFIL